MYNNSDTSQRQQPSSSGIHSAGNDDSYGYSHGGDSESSTSSGGYGSPSMMIFGRSMSDYLHWILRYLWVIAFTTVAGIFLGLYLFSISPATYKSWASIEFKRIKSEAVDIDESEKLKLDASAHFASTLEKLKMPNLYQNIIASPSFVERTDLIPAQKEWRWPWEDTPNSATASGPPPQWLASSMPGWISVSQRENTTIVDLSASHSSPEVCRDLLEQLLIEYERYIDGEVSDSEKYALDFLFEKTDDTESSIMASQAALDRYRECLKYDRLIEATRDQIVQLRTRYRDKWPELIEKNELIRLSSEEFDQELASVLDSSNLEGDYWRSQLNGQAVGEVPLQSKQKTLNSRVNLLEKEVAQQEAMLMSLMTKISAADLSKGFEGKQFSVIQSPTLPGSPVSPGRNQLLVKGGMGGLALGLGVILLIGFLDTSLRTVVDLETVSRLPVVGVIPRLAASATNGERPLFMADDPNSYHSESVRSLRASLSMMGNLAAPSGSGGKASTFLITSSLPGEGKSVLSANLAVSFARQGERTLLIDCDLRKPVQHLVFGCDRDAPGISDALADGRELEAIMQRTRIQDLFVITAGNRRSNPAELLSSRKFGIFLQEIAVHFDRIVIDSAPIIPVSDTLPVARHVDSVVLTCQLGKTPRKALMRTMKVLAGNQTLPIGVIANHLPLPKNKLLYGYYYGYCGGAGYESYREIEENRENRGRRRVQKPSRRNRSAGRRSDAHELLS